MIALTAPMGWNSWDCYGPSVTEETVRKNARYMAEHLKPCGWEYIVVDIQWYEPAASVHAYHPFAELCMDGYSRLIPAENRFPSSAGGRGFAPLADYVHSLGLKFGIHIMRGIPRQAVHRNTPLLGTDRTARQIARSDSICHWNTDMYGVDPEKEGAGAYYDSLFALYASWGVDFVKCDDICRELPDAEGELALLRRAMDRCGREMVLSLSPGPALLEKAELYKQVCQMWRITDDFWDRWELLYAMFERAEKWCVHAGPGHWPDADMLPVGPLRLNDGPDGWTRFTPDEQITMMTLWSIFRSPLMIGGEMTGFDRFTLDLLTNEGILGMHRNARHAHPLWRRTVGGSEYAVWAAGGGEGETYAALFNLGERRGRISVSLEELGAAGPSPVTELWSGETWAALSSIEAELPPHGARAYRIAPARG